MGREQGEQLGQDNGNGKGAWGTPINKGFGVGPAVPCVGADTRLAAPQATAGASKEEELGQDNGNGEGRVGHTIGQPGHQPRELTHISSIKHSNPVRARTPAQLHDIMCTGTPGSLKQ